VPIPDRGVRAVGRAAPSTLKKKKKKKKKKKTVVVGERTESVLAPSLLGASRSATVAAMNRTPTMGEMPRRKSPMSEMRRAAAEHPRR
jgi:hypothetical protein